MVTLTLRLAKNFTALLLALSALASVDTGASGHTYFAQGGKTEVAPRGVEAGQSESEKPSAVDAVGWRARHPAAGSHPRVAALAGPLLRRAQAQTDASGAVMQFTLDANGYVTQENRSVTTPTGKQTLTTQRSVDANGRVLVETDPAGATRQTSWTPFGQPLTETDALNRRTTHSYSDRGERTSTTYADGTKEEFGFDAEGNKISSTDRAGRSTQYVVSVQPPHLPRGVFTRAYSRATEATHRSGGWARWAVSPAWL